MRQLDVDFERLLLRGYSDGASYEPSSNEGAERAWLEQRAVPWWEGIAARARREQISIYCYRGTHEYAAEVSACAEVLHPHTSVPVYLTNDLNERRLSAGESMAERWRTLAASPWTVAPPHDCDLNADYERLCRDGRIVETRGRYADFEEATYGHRAMGWWAALVKQAREDRLTLCCHFFVEDTPTSRPLRHRWFSRRRTRFHFENRAYAPMAERLEERTGLTVSDAVSLLGASPWT